MKFGKRLRMQIEDTLPEWRNKFLSYKELKKRLKELAAPECFTEAACEASTNPSFETKLAAPSGAHADSSAGQGNQGGPANGEGAMPAGPILGRSGSAVRGEIGDSFPRRVPGGGAARAGDGAGPSDSGWDGQGSAHPSPSRVQGPPPSGLHAGANGTLQPPPLPPPQPAGQPDGPGRRITQEEEEFIQLLNDELEKFNNFFIEKEEEYIIRLQELKERIDAVSNESGGRVVFRGMECPEEVMALRQEIVAFHGEMVLLENYSSLNYMGLVKILKKHDKRMGTVLRLPFIKTVLHQPFYTTELLSKLVRECEAKLRIVFPPPQEAAGQASAQLAGGAGSTGENGDRAAAPPEGSLEGFLDLSASIPPHLRDEDEELALPRGEDVDHIYRSTLAALKTLQEMRGNMGAGAAASRNREEGNGSGVSSLTKAGETTPLEDWAVNGHASVEQAGVASGAGSPGQRGSSELRGHPLVSSAARHLQRASNGSPQESREAAYLLRRKAAPAGMQERRHDGGGERGMQHSGEAKANGRSHGLKRIKIAEDDKSEPQS